MKALSFRLSEKSFLPSYFLRGVCLLAVGVVLMVFFLRIGFAISFTQAHQIITSGFEEESLYAVWKYVHGKDVYVDFHKVPFAASYFNWGFYVFYGSITKVALQLFSLGDEWIPTIGRIITLVGCACALWFGLRISRRLSAPQPLGLGQISLLLFLFTGYVMGFWTLTVRPDVWALTFELAGLFLFLRYIKSQSLVHLVFAFLFFYIAWSFKQNFIGMAGGCIIFLALQGRVVLALMVGICFAGSLILTYLAGSADYRYLLILSQAKMHIAVPIGLANLKLAISKSIPVALFIPALVMVALIQPRLRTLLRSAWNNEVVRLLSICAGTSFLLFFIMAMKEGASDNYFFTPLAALALLGSVIIGIIERDSTANLTASRTYALLCTVSLFTGLLVLTGRMGNLDLRESSVKYNHYRRLIDSLQKPVIVERDSYANLPWINQSPRHFVLATTYEPYLHLGERFEYGGVDGLKRQGYFATIVSCNYLNIDNKELYHPADSIEADGYRYYTWRRR